MALATIGSLAHASVHAVQHRRLVPWRVGACLLAVQHATHRVAKNGRTRVVRVIKVVVPRWLLLDNLGMRCARLAQLVSRAHDAVQPRALVKDVFPVDYLMQPRKRVALGQLQCLPLGRRRGVRPLERLVQRVGVRGVGVQPAQQTTVKERTLSPEWCVRTCV